MGARSLGRWFEELPVGLVVKHAMTRTVIDADNVLFSCLTMNPQQIHLDAAYASTTEFGRPLVNGVFTLGLVVGLSIPELVYGTTIANLSFQEVTYPNPVFAGDTISSETEVIESRVSRSRPDAGVVTFQHRGFKGERELVCLARRTALIRRQPADGSR
jgi:acyl dehydratase